MAKSHLVLGRLGFARVEEQGYGGRKPRWSYLPPPSFPSKSPLRLNTKPCPLLNPLHPFGGATPLPGHPEPPAPPPTSG